MINKLCVNCKKPMNGGVYRKPNQCPHCKGLQDKTRSADNKRKVSLEEALAARAANRNAAAVKGRVGNAKTNVVAAGKRVTANDDVKPVAKRRSSSR